MGNFKKAKVILNPTANHGNTGKLIDKVSELLKLYLDFQLFVTNYPRQAENFARQTKGFDLIIGVGGDGTINEIANGMLTSETHPPLGVLPTGSGNDFSKMLGISKNLEKAVKQLIEGKVVFLDVARVNNRFYINSLGIGFDAQVAHLANKTKQQSKKSGILLYLYSLFQVLFKDYRSYKIKLKVDSKSWEEREITLLAANSGKSYGGGFLITPKAKNNDGNLDLCYVDLLPVYQIILRLPFVIIGKHTWMKPFQYLNAKKIKIKSLNGTPIPAHLDGEALIFKELKVDILPQKLPVVAPP